MPLADLDKFGLRIVFMYVRNLNDAEKYKGAGNVMRMLSCQNC
jgi:hypothetical protein